MTKKVALLIPYYGSWPPYFNLYLASCKHNKCLDIYFFTDISSFPQHPSNVHFVHLPINSLEKRIADALNIKDYSLPSSYKLCDLRPLYGKIFEEEIKHYNYWGFGDCDLIYGDLEKFVKAELAQNIDVISFNQQRNSGSLMLLKNSLLVNQLYLKIKNFECNLLERTYKGIDEVNHCWKESDKLKLPQSCFTYVIAKATADSTLTSSYKNRIIEELNGSDKIAYNNGMVIYNGREIAYFHYVCNKDKPYFSFPNWKNPLDYFLITEIGFHKKDQFLTLKRYLKKYPILFIYYLKKVPKWTYKKISNV